jgi:Na+/proline symporter
VAIWYTIGTAIVPGLLVPLIASYFDSLRISARTAFWAMLLGWGVSTGWLLEGQVSSASGRADYWLGIEPMIPGLLVSLVVWMVGKIQSRFPKSSRS